MLGQDVGQRGLFIFEGQTVRHGNHKTRRRRSLGRRFAREYDDKPIGLRHHGARYFEELDGATRFTDGLDQRAKARVFGVKRRREIRTVVRTAIDGFAATTETTTAFAATGAIAPGTARAFSAGATTIFALALARIRGAFTGKFTTLGRSTISTTGRTGTGTARGTIEGPPVAALRRTAATVTPRTIFAAFAAAPLVGRRFVLHP
jgi:hypothetical protein